MSGDRHRQARRRADYTGRPTPSFDAPIKPDARASTVHLPAGAWLTVLDALCTRFPAIPRAQWLDRMSRARVLDAQGLAITPHTPYRVGLRVHYWREVLDEPPIPFAEHVLHVDAELVVADKPHFLPVTPAGGFVEQTLLHRLIQRLDNPRLVPLHRIDRATAGLVLFSANPASRGAYQALFREHRIDKAYEARSAHQPARPLPLLRRSRLVAGEPFFRMREIDGEPNSETHIELLDGVAGAWRYALRPVTGKKHQLRVHMAALGVPILHDTLYPQLAAPAPDAHQRPLQLLARGLAFVDPLSGRPRRFETTQRL